jgi:hypothetical protein
MFEMVLQYVGFHNISELILLGRSLKWIQKLIAVWKPLRELGAIISDHLLRQRRNGTNSQPPKRKKDVDYANIPFTVEIQPDGSYAEIVKIEDLLGRKPRLRGKKQSKLSEENNL